MLSIVVVYIVKYMYVLMSVSFFCFVLSGLCEVVGEFWLFLVGPVAAPSCG